MCLSCLQGFGSQDPINHTLQHSLLTTHNQFLNIRKIHKVDRPVKIAKLEIKEQDESDFFSVTARFYCVSCDKYLDINDENRSVADKILKSQSSEKKQEVKSWTQEIVPCAHALELSQEVVPDLNLNKCGECDLQENLWVCMTCGHVGCGRAQFGGIPGNTHAVVHYEGNPAHPIAVKLGSLSQDSADCYCYQCNDEIKIPNLHQLLRTFGINLEEFAKTEKSLTELQIEQNVNWEFNMDDKEGNLLEPVFGPGLTGFKNLGNSCYLASVLQVLFSLDGFQKYTDLKLGTQDLLHADSSLNAQLFKIADGLLSGRYSKPDETTSETVKYQPGIKPWSFKSLIGSNHEEFSTMRQQDAFEFWMYLTDKLGGNRDFQFLLNNKLKCTSCNGVKITKEVSENVSLPLVSDPTSFDDCFKAFCGEEVVDFTCSNCQASQMEKSTSFGSFPPVLVSCVQRIKLENWVPVKVSNSVIVPSQIDLSLYRSGNLSESEFLLPEQSFAPDKFALAQLQDMGFGETPCIKALFNTKNNVEDAANWLFAHMEDPDIDLPLEGNSSVAEPEIEALTSMGFSRGVAIKALKKTSNLEQAVEWVFSHPDAGEEEEEEVAEEKVLDGEPLYSLHAVICHKGTSVHSGHYVAFIRKVIEGEEKWVLFNDEKVVLTESIEEAEKNGYIFVFKRV